MAHVLTGTTQPLSQEMPVTSEAVLAEALFASPVQASEYPDPDQVRRAIGAQVAAEFGDHPDTAVARMRWALATIRAAYRAAPASTSRVPAAEQLALAS